MEFPTWTSAQANPHQVHRYLSGIAVMEPCGDRQKREAACKDPKLNLLKISQRWKAVVYKATRADVTDGQA